MALESCETTQEIRTRVVAFVEDMKQADLKQLVERHQHYFAEAGPAFKVWCAAMRKDRVWADLDFAVFFTKMIGAAKLEVYTKKLANGPRRKSKSKSKSNNKPQLFKREFEFQGSQYDFKIRLVFVNGGHFAVVFPRNDDRLVELDRKRADEPVEDPLHKNQFIHIS